MSHPIREPGPPSSPSASEAQLHNLRNPLRRPRRLGAHGAEEAGSGKRGPHSAQPVTSSWAPGPPPSQSPFRGVRGHSDHAVLDADRHRGRRPARMWDAVLALGAVDAFCVRSAGCVVAEGESEVSRRAYWRAPRRERKRSHSTPPSRDYGGVERRQCRGAQQLARRSSLKSMSAQKAPAAASRADRQTRRHLRLRAQARQAILPSSATPAPADRQRRTADHGPNGPRTTDQKPIRPRNRKIPSSSFPERCGTLSLWRRMQDFLFSDHF